MSAPTKTCPNCGGELYELLDGYDACRGCGLKLNPGRRLAETLEDVARMAREYVVFSNEHEVNAIALWTAMTHLIDAFDVVMFLHIFSAEPESGKTRLLEVLAKLVRSGWLISRPTAATLFRMIEERQPTVLWDEVDRVFSVKQIDANTGDLQAVVNSGHKRGAVVPRCVGEGKNITVKDFPVFTPMAFAGINQLKLPDTARSRSIPIALRRRAPDEPVRRWREREVESMTSPIIAELKSLALLLAGPLRDARPTIPDGLGDRATDGWEGLLAIAEAAGGEWPRRAREAAVALNGVGRGLDAQTIGVLLLADIKATFEQRGLDRLSSEELVRALQDIEESNWEWVTKNNLARKLRPFGVRPREIRVGDRVPRGYLLEDFSDPFLRYLQEGTTTATTATPQVAPTSDVAPVAVVAPYTGEGERTAPLPTSDPVAPTLDDVRRLAELLRWPRIVWRGRTGATEGKADWDRLLAYLEGCVPTARIEVYETLEAYEALEVEVTA